VVGLLFVILQETSIVIFEKLRSGYPWLVQEQFRKKNVSINNLLK
jgi:hypothetical protein